MKAVHYQNLHDHELSHWWYKARRKLVHDLLLVITARLKHAEQIKILDVGCGTGALLFELGKEYDVAGVDMSERAVNFCKQRGITTVVQGDISKLPFPSASFDVVLALDVLEHVENDVQAVAEIKRVLRPGGTVIIFVPAFKVLWSVTDVLSEHWRRYTKKQLLAAIEAGGLIVKRSTYFNFFLFLPIFLLRVIVRLCRIKVANENNIGNTFTNQVLYSIFRVEIFLLNTINLPVGVSILALATNSAGNMRSEDHA